MTYHKVEKFFVKHTLVKQKCSTVVAFSDFATTSQSSLQPEDAADELEIFKFIVSHDNLWRQRVFTLKILRYFIAPVNEF